MPMSRRRTGGGGGDLAATGVRNLGANSVATVPRMHARAGDQAFHGAVARRRVLGPPPLSCGAKGPERD